jgi:putative drug exporter of the RND superfamily
MSCPCPPCVRLGAVDQLFSGLGRAVVRFRYLVVAGWIALVVISAVTLPSLGSEVNTNNSQFLPSSSPSVRAADLAAPILGSPTTTSQIYVVAARSGSALTPADEAALARLVEALRSVPHVTSSRVLSVSKDGQAAQILSIADISVTDVPAQTKVVNDIIATFDHIAAPPGLEVHVAGNVATNAANNSNSQKTGRQIQLLSILFIIVLLLLVFRSLLAPLVTLIPPVFALAVSMRFIGGLGAHGLKVSQITELLLIVLLLGAGTDYGLFLVFRVREEIRTGVDPRQAVVRALVRVGESISASAGTVIVALLTLLLASFGLYRDLGVPLALGVAVMLIAGLTLLPALLAIFGRAVFWPSGLNRGGESEGAWGRVAARLVRRPLVTLCSGVALFGILALAALGYSSGGFGGSLTAPSGSDAAAGNQLLAEHFPQTSSNPAILVFQYDEPLWANAEPIAAAEASLQASGEFTRLSGPLNPNGTTLSPNELAQLHRELGPPGALPAVPSPSVSVDRDLYDAYRATAAYISEDGRTAQFQATLTAGAQSSTSALQATPHVRGVVSEAAARSGAVDSGLAGQAAALYDISSISNSDLLRIVPVAILAIAVLLALVLRSVIAPLYLIVSVALSYLAALGVSTIVFIYIGGEGGLTFILPFLMFIFLLALGEDYNILVMTRIREEAHRRPLREAVVRAIGRTGPTVTSAGLVLAGSFAVLAFAGGRGSGGSQVRDIGFGLAIGILMDTFLVRTLIVPSVVALLGRWNWWPSRLGEPDEIVEPEVGVETST